jgi:hypothetical protein
MFAMTKQGKKNIIDKIRLARQETHITRAPRMEGKVKNARLQSKRKPPK